MTVQISGNGGITGVNNIESVPAADVDFTPSGNISSTTVQGALNDIAGNSGASKIGYLPAGTGAVATTVQSKLRETVSVKDFGAVGDGVTDDTVAIQAALTYTESRGGGTVYVPTGTYLISSTIKLGRYNILQGESRYGSVIKAATKTFAAIDFAGIAQASGNSSVICDLFIRDADVGVRNTSVTGVYGRIERCQIAYNRIGIQHFDSYINTITKNLIHLNGCGIVMRGQSYAVHIVDNIIDNNTGGMGVYLRGSDGVVIRDNTIEGNRNVSTGIGGCGVMVIGLNQRTLIEGNWLESNCPASGDGGDPAEVGIGVDFMVGNPTDAFTTKIITNCVPAEYQSEATSASVGISGGLTFNNNFHFVSKYGYVVNSQMTTAKINIREEVFTGRLGLFNKGVRILGSASGCNIDLDRLTVVNTANSAINAEMNVGIKNSPVFIEGTAPAFRGVVLDGVDILTAQLTLKEFSELTGASLNITAIQPTSGNAATYNGVIRAVNGVSGVRTVAGTGRSRLRVAGAACFPATGTYYAAFLGSTSGSVAFTTAGGPAGRALTDAKGFYRLESITVTSTEVTLFSGDYWGALVMTQAQYEASSALRFTTRIQILDMDVVSEPFRSSTDPSAYASPSLWNWTQGDIAYNSAPAAGGTIGWVATATGSGTAANWKTFGSISA